MDLSDRRLRNVIVGGDADSRRENSYSLRVARMRCTASCACSRMRPAMVDVTTEIARKMKSASSSCGLATVKV